MKKTSLRLSNILKGPKNGCGGGTVKVQSKFCPLSLQTPSLFTHPHSTQSGKDWGVGGRAHRRGISQAQEEGAKDAEPTPLWGTDPKKWREGLKEIPVYPCSEKHDSQ